MSRTPLRVLLISLTTLLATAFGLPPAPASAASPYCGITWGSQAKVHTGHDPAGDFVRNVRAGRHACFDRLVIDLAQARAFDTYSVQYVPQVRAEGSGHVVPLRGSAALEVVVGAPTYDQQGRPTYAPRNRSELVNVAGFRTFRQVASAGSFEGQSTFGVGTRARLPFRAFTIPGPRVLDVRLVIDVAHRW